MVRPGDVGLPTVNGYAYYRYSRAAMARMMLASPRRAMRCCSSPASTAPRPRWRDDAHPRYARLVDAWRADPLAELTAAELLDGVAELLDAGTAYYTAVQTIIPLAATSEIVFTRFYDRLVRRAGDPPAATFLLGFDSAADPGREVAVRPGRWTRGAARSCRRRWPRCRPAELAGLLRDGRAAAGVDAAAWQEWRARFQRHLDRFGHAVYNLDFANPVPADDPAPLLDTLRFYLAAGAPTRTSARQRRRPGASRPTAAVLARLDPAAAGRFTRLLRWAQGIAPVREDALADIGLAWPQMRRMLLELGRRLVGAGVIDRAGGRVLAAPRARSLAAPADPRRRPWPAAARELWRGPRRATPPAAAARAQLVDRVFERMMPAVSHEQTGDVLTGIGASAGQVTAPPGCSAGPPTSAGCGRARCWSPASPRRPGRRCSRWPAAVVTDIGGPLSHSSIVAREYGIPAVLGTGVATRRIPDGAQVTVDGDAGTVTVERAEA